MTAVVATPQTGAAPVASSSLENPTDEPDAALIVSGVRHVIPGALRLGGLEATAKF